MMSDAVPKPRRWVLTRYRGGELAATRLEDLATEILETVEVMTVTEHAVAVSEMLEEIVLVSEQRDILADYYESLRKAAKGLLASHDCEGYAGIDIERLRAVVLNHPEKT